MNKQKWKTEHEETDRDFCNECYLRYGGVGCRYEYRIGRAGVS